jgi:hypothetical protein
LNLFSSCLDGLSSSSLLSGRGILVISLLKDDQYCATWVVKP